MTAPTGAQDAVLKPSDPVPEGAVPVVGLDFDKFADRNITVAEMVESMTNMGFQATSVGQAAQIINGMVIDLKTSQLTSRLTQGR
jgi:deoxyhypusine synthase